MTRQYSRSYPIVDQIPSDHLCIHDSSTLREKDLVDHWFMIPKGQLLYTAENIPFMIIFHGKPNRNKGPDIQDAIIYIDNQAIRGDIECHLVEKSWFEHGHNQQDGYSNVILHMVSELSVIKSPVNHTFKVPSFTPFNCSLSPSKMSDDYVDTIIQLGNKRWVEKCQQALKGQQNSMLSKALGAGGNEANMKDLLDGIHTESFHTMPLTKQFVFIEDLFSDMEWQHCGIRPNQWPERRLPFILELLNFINSKKFKELYDPSELFDLMKRECPRGGKGIHTEVCINYIFPLKGSMCLANNDHESYKQWNDSWRSLKLFSPYGILEKKYGSFFSRKELCTVGIAQGLLYMEKEYCQYRYCKLCLLKQWNNENKN